MNKRNLGIIAAILAVLLIGALIWGFTTKSSLETERDDMSAEVNQLELLRDKLMEDVDSLDVAFNRVSEENTALQGELSEAQETAKRALYDMRVAQRSRKNDNDVAYKMRLQIEDLINVRAMLEKSIVELNEENDELRARNVQLNRDLSTAKTEAYNATKKADNLTRLQESMEADLERLTLGNFKASAIQLDLTRRNDSPTANASRARKITISFDLTDVPREFLGVRPIYFVMVDQMGNPVTSENPVTATVKVDGQDKSLIALEGRDVNVEPNQRISFTHELDDKLDAGYYRAQIYTDLGLLGQTSVQLR